DFQGGRRGKGNEGHLRMESSDFGNIQIGLPEVIAPLRDTVRLVHSYHIDIHLFESFNEQIGFQSFWRDIEKLIIPINAIVQNGIDFSLAHARVNRRSENVLPS